MTKRFHLFITLPILTMLAGMAFFLFLPYLLDFYIFPRLIAELPVATKELSITRLSPWETRGSLTLADEDRPILSVPKFQLFYTPSSLLRRKIAILLLDSASLQVEIQDGQPILRGMPTSKSSPSQEDNTSAFLLPLAVDTIILKNCSFTVHRDKQKPINIFIDSRITLDFLDQPENRKLLSTLAGQLQTRGDLSLSGKFAVRSVDKLYEADLQVQVPDTSQLTAYSPALRDLQTTGRLTIGGQATFNRISDQSTAFEVTVSSPDLRFGKNDFLFETSSAEIPATIQLTGNMDKVHYRVANIHLVEPERTTFDLAGEMALSKGTFSGTGHIFWQKTNSRATIDLNGNTQQAKTAIQYTLTSDAFALDDTVSFSSFKADGELTLDGANLGATLNTRIPEISLQKNTIRLINLSLQLPFQYPPPQKEGPAGIIKIEQMRYQNINSGNLKVTVNQLPKGAAFSSLFTTPLVPGLRLSCKGSAPVSTDMSVHCQLPRAQFNSSAFPSYLHLPKELTVSGKLGGAGEFHLTDKGVSGKLDLDVGDGSLTYGENTLSKINIAVVLPHLPQLRSNPGQLCTIGALEFGKIKLANARIHFRIEDEQAVTVEKMRADWCGGKVESGSFTLAGNMQELETTLYCDRVGFTELLAQFGIDKAEGQGSLNGRLPMTINRHGVIFDDGFLFSTPGNNGIVRFTDTKQLRQGMPDIEKSAYLDYSMKALENFAYNWAKLSFNSQKDDLLITMQLDGKPAEPLPFGYENGQIVTSGKGPGLQHPIRLDVNFRLPMQEMFHYGKSIQSIMEKM